MRSIKERSILPINLSQTQKEMLGLIDKDGDLRDDRILWVGYTGRNDGVSKTILDVDEDGGGGRY